MKIIQALKVTVFLPILLMPNARNDADLINPATFPPLSMQAVRINEAGNRLITNERINIIHAPLSDLFLVYSELLDMSNSYKRTGYLDLKFTKLFGI